MKKHILYLAIFCSHSWGVLGQSFSYHSASPFGIQLMRADSSGAAQQIHFFDMDGDEDLDILLTGLDDLGDLETWESIRYFMEMQENIGSKSNPMFGDRIEVFPNFPFPAGYFFPAIGDINQDGDPDFIVYGEVNYYGGRTMLSLQSNGTGVGYDVIRGDAIGLEDFVPESFFIPELVDLDLDGDLDILMSGANPAFAEEDGEDVPTYYYGRNSSVVFEGWHWNPYGLMPNPLIDILTSGDIDNDGDIDLLGAPLLIPPDSINYLYVHLNAQEQTGKPSFVSGALASPFGLPSSFGEDQFLFPNLEDIDGDGDLDLFVFMGGPGGTMLLYYENNLCEGTTSEMSVTLCEGESVTIGDDTFTEEGSYVIVLEDINGCDSAIFLDLIVEETYEVQLNETICSGESFQIGNEEFTMTGLYQVLLYSADGCDSLIFLDLYVDFVDNSLTIEENNLIANLPDVLYQWIDCDTGNDISGETGQSYEVTETGNYSVEILNPISGCMVTSECVHIIVSGTKVVQYFSMISVYPVPADERLFIMNFSSFPITRIILINMAGQIVATFDRADVTSMDISELNAGVYFAKIELAGREIVKKIIII